MPVPDALVLDGVSRGFKQGPARIEVLKGIDLRLAAGEVAALVGVSGAGKSTLLQIAGLLERPDAGEVMIAGERAARRDRPRTRLRRDAVGFVYQFHHLLAEFTACENVMLPCLLAGSSRAAARARAEELLGAVGLAERLAHHPGQLSGGEQQRVAIARGLANAPGLVLADEPTGNLDEETAAHVFDGFLAVLRARGASALIATHDRRLARRLDRVYVLAHGRLAAEPAPAAAEETAP
ncbi:MAG: ATP-binding cassette domain-containing protein [Alphaproteobacteria bacterium]|nr:ATP-binding cassette domain-containing protein [Alphaproteobacteria bacterium]